MSILIKMEMPKNCEECLLCGFVSCNVTGQRIYSTTLDRLPDCPLIEVPPHGRLIDADALLKYCDAVYGLGNNISIGAIINAPTIIEAEGKE